MITNIIHNADWWSIRFFWLACGGLANALLSVLADMLGREREVDSVWFFMIIGGPITLLAALLSILATALYNWRRS